MQSQSSLSVKNAKKINNNLYLKSQKFELVAITLYFTLPFQWEKKWSEALWIFLSKSITDIHIILVAEVFKMHLLAII